MGQSLLDGFFRDLVKHQPMHRHLGLQQFMKMPTDGLPFAVFVRRQVQVFGVFEQALQFFDLGRFSGRHDIDRIEVVVDINPQVGPVLAFEFGRNLFGPLGQISDVANAGLDRVAVAQKLANRAGFGWRFDDHERFAVSGS